MNNDEIINRRKTEIKKFDSEITKLVDTLRLINKRGALYKKMDNDNKEKEKKKGAENVLTKHINNLIDIQSADNFYDVEKENYANWKKNLIREFCDIENLLLDYRKRTNKILAIASISSLIFVTALLFIFNANIGEIIGVNTPSRYIILGVIGAFMHYAMKIIENEELARDNSGIKYIITKLIVSLVFPLVVVMLIYDDDQKASFEFSPEMASFLFGYSSTLLSGFLTKIVDLGQRVIDAL